MSDLMKSVDERTRLAGTNRMEILLFSLGTDKESGRKEVFGINVFKVREVMHVPDITRAPDMPESVEGMVSLRGITIPVINLPKYCGIPLDKKPSIMIITEYNKNVQGFLVDSVDNIERLAWDEVKAPPSMMNSQHGGLVTAVTDLGDKGLVMIMDVEKVLAEATDFYNSEATFQGVPNIGKTKLTVLFADDSGVAREQIKHTLDEMGAEYISTENGQQAWSKLIELAEKAESEGCSVKDYIQVILTDVEMPEMDGYVLTRNVKADERFDSIPVIMHSSLSTEANQFLGESVGADAYVAKFKPIELANALLKCV